LYFLFRALRNRGYWRSLAERMGFLPHSFRQTGPGAIWLHAVSVGEVLSCIQFVRRLRAEFPQSRLFVSASTLAGRATAGEKLSGLADGVFYVPVDYVWAVRRVLRTLQPSMVVVAETEIWPNLFREVKRTGAGLLLVNGRISDRAWPRYLRFRPLFEAVLPHVDAVQAQTDVIRERFVTLGAPPEKVTVAGNFKYDFDPRPAAADSPVVQYLYGGPPGPRRTPRSGKTDEGAGRADGPPPIWIAASTMPPADPGDPDEDDAVIAAFHALAPRHPDLLLLLAPRRPERFDAAAAKLDAAGIPYVRRSALPSAAAPRVLLLDSIGELAGLFAFADIVFMGGTLAHRGGHNILEPALFGKPVIVGPHMENFQAIADEFHAAGACVSIADGAALAAAVERLLDRPEEARAIGERALACAQARRGATSKAVHRVRALYDERIPRYRPAMPWFALRWALARVWVWGGRRRQARHLREQRRLPVPVIGVGNLTMGGTGKTPCVLLLAEALRARGRSPGILTRGYGRTSPDKSLALAPGAVAFADHTGDEPQLFVRSALAPVGIGADRFEVGKLLLDKFNPDVLLLDDGFQHLRLARDLDIVLIDALNPLGGGDMFPLGRLREPVSAVARAGIVLITRSDLSDTAPAIERLVRRWNPGAAIFRARVSARAWIDNRTGEPHPPDRPPFRRAAAFCGVGNPQSFRRTLERLGVLPADWVTFPDHHRYRPNELRSLAEQARASGADAVVTTEKDAVNLCDGCDDLFAPVTLFRLQVAMAIDRESEFLHDIERRIAR
jgi:3-deoxy-D-manno-octulosonic-acid transferase